MTPHAATTTPSASLLRRHASRRHHLLATTLVATAVLAFTGCASVGAGAAGGTPPDASGRAAADVVTVTDPWVKAAESGMSAAFGTLANAGDAEVVLVSVETEASSMSELHETIQNDAGEMIMRAKEGGFAIPAGGSLDLEPGGSHIMLMDLAAPIAAGEEITFVLTFSDDSTLEFTAPAKDYSGANETYEGDDETDGHEGGH